MNIDQTTTERYAVTTMWNSLADQKRITNERFIHGAVILIINAYEREGDSTPTHRKLMCETYNEAVRHGFLDC